MTMWNLGENAINQLVDLPETGMGFQFIEARIMGSYKNLLVLNAEHAFDLSAIEFSPGVSPYEIMRNGLRVLEEMRRTESTMFSAPAPSDFKLLNCRVSVTGNNVSGGIAPVIVQSSTLVKKEKLASNRKFFRFSAYNPDRRVDLITGDFAAGTYATTDNDEPFVPSGFAAVGRYALPNNSPASYKYTIIAPAGEDVEYGTVAPAFGQSGGGVEALFNKKVKNQAKLQPPVKMPDE